MSGNRPATSKRTRAKRDHAHDEPHGHDHPHDDHGHDDHGQDAHAQDDHGHGHGDHGHGHDHGDHDHDHPSGVWGAIKSVFVPHSHDPGDAIAGALEATNEGMRALKISLVGLGITAAIQVVIVVISSSVALLADTIHNFADAMTAVPLGIAFWMSRKVANKRYTHGYGRAEDIAGVMVVATITFSAILAAYEAIQRLLNPQDVHHLGWVFVAGLTGFVGNELVAVYRIRVGRRIGSAALVADGLHARTDGITSLAVVIGAIGVWAGYPKADPIVGLVISGAIFMIAASAARDIYHRLMDAVDPSLVDAVYRVLGRVEGVQSVESVRLRWIGHELHAEAEIGTDPALTLAAAHAISEQGHHELLHAMPRLSRATIHTCPLPTDGEDRHPETAHHAG